MSYPPLHSRLTRLALLLVVFAATFVGMAASAQAEREFSLRYSTNETGSLVGISNANMTCSSSSTNCSNARSAGLPGSNPPSYLNNDNHDMTWVDVDGNSSTTNSSTADLSVPAGSSVQFAALYWGGRELSGGTPSSLTDNQRKMVKIKLPGASGYTTVTASALDKMTSGNNKGIYQSYADVTNLITPLANAGSGTYTVADIASSAGATTGLAGWSLIVVYKNAADPMRNITIFDGLVNIASNDSRNISVSGFVTPPSGAVNARAGFVTYEGDLGLVGDSAKVNGTLLSDGQHPSTNFFNSRSSHDGVLDADRNPAYANNLGFEGAWMPVPNGAITNNATSATINVSTNGDNFVPGVITLQVDIYAPDVKQTKTATDDNGGQLEQGDTITYKIAGKNNGKDGATNFVMRDSIPPNTTYVPGSIKINKSGGAPTGNQTDASGDDRAEFDSANNRIIARLGTGSNASVGGLIAPTQEYEVTFQVRVNGPTTNPVPSGTVIHNEAISNFNSQTGGITLKSEANVDVSVKAPDLRIVKTRTGADFVAGGTSQYTLAVDNHGDANTQGQVTVSDPLPVGLTVTAVNAPGWTCNALPADHLSCSRSNALAPGASYPNIVVTVAIGDDVDDELENISTVSGGGDANLGDNSSSSTNPVSRKADLAIVKTASQSHVKIGDTFTYALKVTNNGPSRATSVAITDDIPAGLSFVSADPGCTFQPVNGTVVCAVGTLANGATKTINVTVKVDGDAGGLITNTASVAAQQEDPNPGNNTDTETVDARGADLQVTKTLQSPAPPVKTGDTVTYKIVVKNNGPSNATGVVLYDALPAGLTNVTTDDNGCVVAAGSITCPLGNIANGASKTVTVTGKVIPNQASLVNTASATGNEDDPTPENNTSTVTTPVTPQVDLAIVKQASVAKIDPGSQFTYTFKVTNNGPDPATNAVVTDTLPAGLAFVSSADCSAAGQVITCAAGDLGSGDSVQLSVLVAAGGGVSGNVVNTASVSGDQPDPVSDNNTSTVTTPVQPKADLGVVKTKKSPATVKTGDTVTYEIVVTNHGPSNATGVNVTDELPAGLTAVTADHGCAVASGQVNCALGSLANGASVTITVTGKVKPGQTSLANTAKVKGNEPDPNPNNDTSTVTTPVTPQADLGIVKEASKPAVDAGDNLDYTFKVTNNGPDNVTGITVTDTLPAGVTYVDGAPGCSAAGQVVTCTINFLAAGGSGQTGITVKVTGAASDPVVNTAKVGSDVPDPNPNNDTSTIDTPVHKNADLGVVKTKKSPATVKTGDTVTYEIVVTNHGPSNATGVNVTDQLPAGLTNVTADHGCSVASGQVTCSLGSLANGASVTITVTGKVKPGQTSLANTAKVKGDQPDPNPNNDTSTVENPVTPQADLGIQKLASVSEITPGEEFTYTFKVTNNGPDNVTGITVTDTLPAGVTYVDGAPGCNAVGQVVTCTINFLAAGGSGQTGISVKYTGNGTSVGNTAKVGSNVPDPNPNNDTSTIDTPVKKNADVQIVKTVDNPNPQAGDTITYTLTVKNNGPGTATDVVATDQLPSGVTFVSADSPCVQSNGKVTCELGDLDSGEEVALKIKVKVNPWNTATTNGTHGVDVQKVETQIDLNPGETKTIQAVCPSGFFVSDGSVRIDHVDQGTGDWTAPEVLESRAINNSTWQGTVTNTATGRVQAKIFAVCIRETTSPDTTGHNLKVSDPVVTTVDLHNGNNEAVLNCPAGTTAIAPGFIADEPGLLVYSQPEGNGWKFVYKTDSAASGDHATFSIRCLDKELSTNDGHTHDLSFQRIWTEQTIQPGDVNEVQLICPDGSKGIVGGWDLDDGLVSLGNDPRPVTRAFKVYNPTDHPLKVRYSLLCLGDRTSGTIVNGGSNEIINTADVASGNDTDPSNNSSSVTVNATPNPGDDPVDPGTGKNPVNNPIAKTIVGKGVTYSASGVTFTLKCSGSCGGIAKLTTLKKVKVGGKKFARGTLLAKKRYFIGKAGTKKVKLKLTKAGKRVLKSGKVKKASLRIAGGTRKVVKVGRR